MIDGTIEDFWKWFRAEKAAIERSTSSSPVRDELLARLQQIDEGLFYEISLNQEPFELVITCEGKRSLYPLAEEIVQAAPAVPKWSFFALKQPLGFGFKTQYEGLSLDPGRMWFLPLLKKSDPRVLGLRIGIKDYDAERKRDFLSAALVILETGLGERSAAEEIVHVECVPLPESPGEAGYIELSDLSAYLEWRRGKNTAAG